ncbi:dihydropteroate synthase [Nitrincola sp. A-D6]|uniref:dihydropteroate synthase n=1 Tax=Nitrincola sp. A-D6 TaxID=1545442 RepID=UPI00051FBCA3|nr:dihydropteroate synthase [Nitrincola sp. A-D6]KGK41379.1 dihydropteroate synthase [Nitrincola sp. A-D6]
MVLKTLRCGRRELDISRPVVMGVVNVTPDSFSDGGRYFRQSRLCIDVVLRQAEAMVASGAKILDVGGESTRPGATPVSVSEEMDRVLPVIEQLAQLFDVVISLDSSQAEVIDAAAKLGMGLINDVRSLSLPGALDVAAKTGLPVCLMHMQGGGPATMQLNPDYADVVEDVQDFLQQQVVRCGVAGIAADQILLDPGFGFGKSLRHNLTLLNRLDQLVALGYPVLSGTSRKSMVGQVTGKPVDQRLAGSLATALLAAQKGAAILRVHDVAETVDALNVLEAVYQETWEI